MSHKPTTVEDLPAFSVIIDARSPAEYALDHIPGAINCPVLDDEERRVVGTTYVQVSAFEARKMGAAMVARNIAHHLDTQFRGQPREWRPLVYCWRGGMRSGSFVNVMRMVGWDAQQLQGGYKAWRAHVVQQLAQRAPQLCLKVLCGPTGSAKTQVLRAMERQGQQVLDLEALAVHRGSVLGDIPGQPQPSQKAFETALMDHIARFDLARTVWVEAESRRIGKLTLPEPLHARLRESPVVEIAATLPARMAYLLRDYAWLGDDPQLLIDKLSGLSELLPKETLAQWRTWAQQHELAPLLESLLLRHYDPLYARSQGRHLERLEQAQRVDTDDLSPEGIDALAQRIASLH
ncbi:tRNA 2-selenouridine(34) synthase MnmH [Piscinibacter terrae]|uniref:tRNA 2-selenouridine(34) synthase MnmH n=1 Tax=Piscinibacter terrae TaxID=2496871 RepID=UPI001F197919|nr:tRNA 2-selenouridine(34) synthase MnmH [Albitalea terrae]